MKFEHTFTLDREHFNECFEQSAMLRDQSWRRYTKAIILFALGFLIAAANIEKLSGHLGYFFYILAVVEILSVRFARGFWVTRQMFSKASGSDVNISFDDQGIEIYSDYVKKSLPWAEIDKTIMTEKGYIVFEKNGSNSYISRSILTADSEAFLKKNLAID
ncbi:YcxB family protein [Thalassotalea maritima]|uniref:YcxB family protein n=1 Tax=Thalassotalea maritima TaxID=3242416 RepID=UPI00352776A5